MTPMYIYIYIYIERERERERERHKYDIISDTHAHANAPKQMPTHAGVAGVNRCVHRCRHIRNTVIKGGVDGSQKLFWTRLLI